MSIIGIDLGNYNICIGKANNEGINILTNRIDDRNTRSMISIKNNYRTIGNDNYNSWSNNTDNTFYDIQYLLGKKINDIEQEKILFKLYKLAHDFIGMKIDNSIITCQQLLSILLIELFDNFNINNSIETLSISVPYNYSFLQRKMLQNISNISEKVPFINLINSHVALGIEYGIWKSFRKEFNKPKNILFIDLGEYQTIFSIIEYTNNSQITKYISHSEIVSGKNITNTLYNYLLYQFEIKYKNIRNVNNKTKAKLWIESEKIKKKLSLGTQKVSGYLECLFEHYDFDYQLEQEEYSKLLTLIIRDLKKKLITCKNNYFIDSIEVIGGTSRIPYIKNAIKEILKKDISFTLNSDEAVAKGTTIYSAIISKKFKFFDYHIKDINTQSIFVLNNNNDKKVNIINKQDIFPVKKNLSMTYYNNLQIEVYQNNISLFKCHNINYNLHKTTIYILIDIQLDGIIHFKSCYFLKNNKPQFINYEIKDYNINNNYQECINYEKKSKCLHNDILQKNIKKNILEGKIIKISKILDSIEIELDINSINKLIDKFYNNDEDNFTLNDYNNMISNLELLSQPLINQQKEIHIISKNLMYLKNSLNNINKLLKKSSYTELIITNYKTELKNLEKIYSNFQLGKNISDLIKSQNILFSYLKDLEIINMSN